MDFLENLDPVSVAIGVGIGALMAIFFRPKAVLVNPSIQKDSAKVSTVCPVQDIEDIASKNRKNVASFCRCWRSKTFPYCDGAHKEYNKKHGDNTGPLVIRPEEK